MFGTQKMCKKDKEIMSLKIKLQQALEERDMYLKMLLQKLKS